MTNRCQASAITGRFCHVGCWLLLSLLVLAGSGKAERFSRVLVGADIPRRLPIGSHFVFEDSDSLYLNSRRLIKGRDYDFDSRLKGFDLSRLAPGDNDTLEIICHRAPAWLVEQYGRSLQVDPSTGDQPNRLHKPVATISASRHSDVTVRGAKTFRVSSQTDGGNEFSQSLDLNLSGQLTPGLTITGSVSDRGYNPSYGTSNSRLSELDKLHLKVASSKAVLELGDLRFPPRFQVPPNKRVSGAAFALDHLTWNVAAVVARPKGRHASSAFTGQDQIQGPYSVTTDGNFQAVVPGSETVWLDGSRLTAGSGEDYVIDYPTGRLTFMPHHAITRRSRIEVDFEPAARAYEGEMYGGAVGLYSSDSVWSLQAQWLLEGDDKSQPLLGELSTEDKRLLAEAGDTAVSRSGVVADAIGDYRLVIDSLPDSVFQYVGPDLGDYRISFGYQGPGGGSYTYLGNGIYEYVGPGAGDYATAVGLTPPIRDQQLRAELRHRSDPLGTVVVQVDQTVADANLLSEVHDNDNSGGAYRLTGQREFGAARRPWLGVTYLAHYRQAEYRENSRFRAVDRGYSYMVPDKLALDETDERQYEVDLALRPTTALSITPSWGRLRFTDRFEASRHGVGAQFKSKGIVGSIDWYRISAAGAGAFEGEEGQADNIVGRGTIPLVGNWHLDLEHEYDRRWYGRVDSLGGTRHWRRQAGLSSGHESLSYEHFVEDTLDHAWRDSQTRQQLRVSSDRRLYNLHYRGELVRQWSERAAVTQSSTMGRLSYDYDDRKQRLHVGSSYLVSQESRNARGIRYLEVEPGRGDFVLEDDQYVPDPNGDFIRVEELLSDQPTVRRGERGFDLRKVWTDVLISVRTRIEEELLSEGSRSVWWVLPFWSDESQPYLFYFRERYAETRLIEWQSFYLINISLDDSRESRRIGTVDRISRRRSAEGVLKQTWRDFYFEQAIRIFNSERDAYYSGAGEIDGQLYRVTTKRSFTAGELGVTVGYRLAEAVTNDRSEQTSLRVFGLWHLLQRGQAEASIEGYSQQLQGGQTASYALTDNRPGSKGAVWSLSVRIGDDSGLRADLRLSGRHADTRKPRVTARAELVAGF